MREIKFRAWDKNRNMFLEQENLIITNGQIFESFRDLEDWTPENNSTLLQYTGSKDKNGVEIYEGDVYRYRYYFSNDNWEYRNRVVKYSSVEIEYQGLFHGYEFDESNIEVIGNIYENPELLAGD